MKLNEQEAVERLHSIPLLVVIGEKDCVVGVEEAQATYQIANHPKTIVIIEGANHIYQGKEQELISRVLEWVDGIAKF